MDKSANWVRQDAPTKPADLSSARLAKGSAISLAGAFVGRGLQVASQIVIARLFGPTLFGFYAIGWNTLRIGSTLSQLGLDAGVTRFASVYEDKAKLKGAILAAVGLSFLVGSAIGLALYVGAVWLAEAFDKPELQAVFEVLAFAIPFLATLMVAAAAIRASLKIQYSVLAKDVVQPVAHLALVVGFYALGWQLFGALYALTLSCVVGLVVSLYYLIKIFPEVSKAAVKTSFNREILTFSAPLLLASMLYTLTVWMDVLMLGYFRPAAEVGVFQAVAQIAMLFLVILRSLNAMFSPMAARLHHGGASGELGELFRASTKWLLYLSVPPVLVILVAPELVLRAVFGQDYVAGAIPLMLLTLGYFAHLVTGPLGPTLIMTGHQRSWVAITGAALLLNVVLNLLLVPQLGMVGAAVSTCASLGAISLMALIWVKAKLGLFPYGRNHLKVGVAGLATAGVLRLVVPWLVEVPALIAVVLLALLSVAGFAGVLLLWGLDTEDQAFIDRVLRRV